MGYRKELSDLRTSVRDNVDESSASFFSNAQLNRFINRAMHRVWTEGRKLKDDFFAVTRSSTDGSLTILGETYVASSFQIAASTRDYTLPHDFVEMRLIECITSGYEWVRFVSMDIAHPDMRTLLEIADNQDPSAFAFDIIGERTMRIAPMSATTLDLRITYIQSLADLSDDADDCQLPHPLYMAVEEYATATAMAMDRNPDAAAHEARGRQIVTDFFGAHARQTQDVEVTQGYGGWS